MDKNNEIIRTMISEHNMWLENPHTVLVLRTIKQHEEDLKKSLQERILISSNEQYENDSRSCIKTTNLLHKVISNSALFVSLINKNKTQ